MEISKIWQKYLAVFHSILKLLQGYRLPIKYLIYNVLVNINTIYPLNCCIVWYRNNFQKFSRSVFLRLSWPVQISEIKLVFGGFCLASHLVNPLLQGRKCSTVLNRFFIDGSWRFRIKRKLQISLFAKLHNSSNIFDLFEHCLKINLFYLSKKG